MVILTLNPILACVHFEFCNAISRLCTYCNMVQHKICIDESTNICIIVMPNYKIQNGCQIGFTSKINTGKSFLDDFRRRINFYFFIIWIQIIQSYHRPLFMEFSSSLPDLRTIACQIDKVESEPNLVTRLCFIWLFQILEAQWLLH